MRRAGALLLLSLGATLLASCSSLFGLDEYSDSTEDLCDLAQKCYEFSGCESHVGPKLDGASAEERSEWLAAIPSKACLASCAKSRKCLNLAPVCSDYGAACAREEECCGFLGGTARCRLKLGGASNPDAGTTPALTCCRPDGVQTSDPSSCCSGIYNPKNKACGQNVCRPAGSACTDDLQCCSGDCEDTGFCAEEQCLPLDTPCAPGDSCCDGAECLPDRGVCGFAQACRELRAPCNVGDPTTPCCQGLDCQKAVNKHPIGELYDGLCQAPPNDVCLPKGYGCAGDGCCSGLECRGGECKAPCSALDTACADNSDCCSGKCEVDPVKGPICKCAQIYCELQDDCCSGICVGGVCTGPCATETTCHDECIPGPALVMGDTAKCGVQVDASCVQKVCAQDKYCCCVEWDTACVKLAVGACGPAACN